MKIAAQGGRLIATGFLGRWPSTPEVAAAEAALLAAGVDPFPPNP